MIESIFEEIKKYIGYANLSERKWERLKKAKDQDLVDKLLYELHAGAFADFRKLRNTDLGTDEFWENKKLFGFQLKENKKYDLVRKAFRVAVAELHVKVKESNATYEKDGA
jgi:hypothetical protein